MKLPKRIYRRLVKTVKFSLRIPLSAGFAFRHRRLRGVRKIIYAATPPPYLPNIGDHAQVVAIRRWMKQHFPDLEVIELDMDQCKWYLPAVRWLSGDDDLIFFHSGGNLGDRGIWCESRRRLLIRNFPRNIIVSLPQTIYFSDSSRGRRERGKTCRIYAAHRRLTVIARDPESATIARRLFPRARTLAIPDFVLSLPPRDLTGEKLNGQVLLCLRLDNEAALTPQERRRIPRLLSRPAEFFDTTFSRPIPVRRREELLEETLAYFSAFDAVITDRYHGVIFAVLCRKPCLVLPTVDHKLTSAIEWFKDINFVSLVSGPEAIPGELERILREEDREVPDWDGLYFRRLPELLGLKTGLSGAGDRGKK